MRASRDLSNLIEELSQESWQPLLEQVMDEHFGPAMEAFDLEFGIYQKRLARRGFPRSRLQRLRHLAPVTAQRPVIANAMQRE